MFQNKKVPKSTGVCIKHHTIKVVSLLIIGSILSSCSNIQAKEIDSLLINKSLNDLIQKENVFYGDPNGEIVVYEDSLLIDINNKDLKSRNKSKCELSTELKDSFKSNNKSSTNLKSIVKKSDLYRFKKPKEKVPNIENIFSGKVKSYISVSKPGYSLDRKNSVVIINYSWSIHSAFAKLVYTNKSNKWELGCSELIIHP